MRVKILSVGAAAAAVVDGAADALPNILCITSSAYVRVIACVRVRMTVLVRKANLLECVRDAKLQQKNHRAHTTDGKFV